MIDAATIPALPRGVRTHADRVRGVTVLLGPERVLMIDDIGAAILSQVDGMASIAQISSCLATKFSAPADVIETDVMTYLSDLADKRLVELHNG